MPETGNEALSAHILGNFTVPDEIFRCLFNSSNSTSSGGIWIAYCGKNNRSHYTSGNIMMTKIHSMFSKDAALMAGLPEINERMLSGFRLSSWILFLRSQVSAIGSILTQCWSGILMSKLSVSTLAGVVLTIILILCPCSISSVVCWLCGDS